MTRPAFHTDIPAVSCSRPLNQGSWGDIDMHDHVILRFLFSRTPKVSSESQAYRYSAPQNCPYEPHSFTQGKPSNLTSRFPIQSSSTKFFPAVASMTKAQQTISVALLVSSVSLSHMITSCRHTYTNSTRCIALPLTLPTTRAAPIPHSDRDHPSRMSPLPQPVPCNRLHWHFFQHIAIHHRHNLQNRLIDIIHSSHSGHLSPLAHISSSSSATASSHSTMYQPHTQS
jgi:hypothetical protein